MYYSAIGLLAILTLLIVNWDVFFDSGINEKPAWKVYRKFLFAVLAYYVTDVLWGLIESRKLSDALFVDTTVYFVAMAASLTLWVEFIVTYLEEKGPFGRALRYLGRGLAGVVFGISILNVFIPVLFTVDEECVYKALPSRYVLLVCQIVFLIVISVYALTVMFSSGIRAAKSFRFRMLAAFGLIMAACLFIQLWFPYLPLYSIAFMLGTCLLHSFVVREEKEDYRQELEEAGKIAELKERFRSLLDNMPGMTFTKDAETGRYLACNQAMAEYAQKDSPDAVVGLTDDQIFDPETAAHFNEADKIALSLSRPYVFYEEVLDAGGKKHQLQTTKIKYTDTSGRLCVLGMCQDKTDLVSVQREHALTKEAYENAVDTGLLFNHIAQTLAKDYTEMFYINTDTEEFTEYRGGEDGTALSVVRSGWHFFSDCKAELSENVYHEDKEAFLQAINRKNLMKALGRKDTCSFTFRRMVQNCPVYFSMKISRMKNDDRFIIVGFSEIDAEMRDTIARRDALNDALSSAEAANKAKTAILSGMSHEIRTPINAIIGLDNLALKKAAPDAKTREYLEKIGESAQHLLSVMNDILYMSRIDSGKEVLNNAEFSLSALVEQVEASVVYKCSEKGIEYESDVIGHAEGTYYGDDMKLKEVLLNILLNSVKYTDAPGSVTLTVEKTAEHNSYSTLRFRIKDTGIGISEEDLPNIFEAFPNVNEGNKATGGSVGLGLAITKHLVDMMNGTITVESEKGAGTEFTVTVTLLRADGKPTEEIGEIDPHALFVLVVDDNPIEAEHAKMVLEEAEIRSDFCTSGQEALEKMEAQHAIQQPYSIVLMDWDMTGMSGRETAAEIIKRYKNESTVVAMTAFNWGDICDEAQKAGVDSYLAKPLSSVNIIANIEQIARRNNMAIFKEKRKARMSGRRILLAEDVELNAEILMDMLDMENIKVDHAENGKVAVELFENSTEGIYSAILMDVRMPQMDGLEAAKIIRSMDREDAKRIPIISLTANAFDEDIRLSLQAGMNAHLSKPVDADVLIRTLGEMVYEAEHNWIYRR